MEIENIKTHFDPNDDSKLIVDFTFRPVQPVQYINMTTMLERKQTWKTYLRELYAKYVVWKDMKIEGEDPYIDQLNEVFKEKYPGPFVVEEFYNPKIQGFDARLKFDDPKEQTLWLLKNTE